jgi:hypothetical protein
LNFVSCEREYKVWCSNLREVKDVLAALEKRGVVWWYSRKSATDYFNWSPCRIPVGFHIESEGTIDTRTFGNYSLSFSETRELFSISDGKEVSVEEFLDLLSLPAIEPAKGNLTTLFEESIS